MSGPAYCGQQNCFERNKAYFGNKLINSRDDQVTDSPERYYFFQKKYVLVKETKGVFSCVTLHLKRIYFLLNLSLSNNKKDIFVFLFENVLNSDNFIYYFCCVELLKIRTTYLWISH